MRVRNRKIELKSPADIEAMRVVCQLAADTLCKVDGILRPGITTEEINAFVHEDTLAKGAVPAPLNYRGFPKSTCTSINEVVCHGIPGSRAVEPGDIINVDITHIFDGYYGDTSATFYIGEPNDEAKHVVEVCRRSLELGMAQVRDGARLGDIGAAIQEFVEGHGCSVVRDFVGHGIGRKFHMEPMVSHVGKFGNGPKLKTGMIFTIEPMINLGKADVEILDDGWTAVTTDRSLSAQFEHTIVVTDTGCEILTERNRPLLQSERYPDYFG
ncbi:MAG: type I methionyl aminopeptidase [Candidatus Eisenbacteria bacterium]|uniref:Methionine aminopeptidase n=1 Tax=Eiseniibacteriota bacterium TaxID=2212470 RepID=A0A956SCH3_UNCEI|nr:type I methionyl aminopeptidase [Candidatus Eisenbacteria bacterium]MCB9466231.1 type I methionyl aminopeptidase [Candidatus Eisenbacteria bacterium]